MADKPWFLRDGDPMENWLDMMFPTMKRDDPLRLKLNLSNDALPNVEKRFTVTIDKNGGLWIVLANVQEGQVITGGTLAKPYTSFEDAIEAAKHLLDVAKEDELGG